MGIHFEAPSSMESSGNYISKKGKYLVSAVKIDEAPKGCIGGWAIDGNIQAAEPENQDQVGRSFSIKFWPPKPDSKDKGEFKRKIWCRAALALGWMTPEQVKSGGAFSVDDTTSAEGRIFFAELKPQDDNPKYFELDSDHIYHVDDPLAKDYPHSDAVLAQIPPEGRYDPARLDFGTKKEPPHTGKPAFDAGNL